MQTITKQQRQFLRRLAHHIDPVVRIGKQGITEELLRSVDQVLTARELIKVKFIDFKEERRELAESLAEATGSVIVTVIGNIAIIYRAHVEPARRKIDLPA